MKKILLSMVALIAIGVSANAENLVEMSNGNTAVITNERCSNGGLGFQIQVSNETSSKVATYDSCKGGTDAGIKMVGGSDNTETENSFSRTMTYFVNGVVPNGSNEVQYHTSTDSDFINALNIDDTSLAHFIPVNDLLTDKDGNEVGSLVIMPDGTSAISLKNEMIGKEVKTSNGSSFKMFYNEDSSLSFHY